MCQLVYPHNILVNTTFHLLENIENKVLTGDQNGIDLECIACLTLCAASVEALVNWMGQSVITEWKMGASAPQKVEMLFAHAGINYDASSEPLATITWVRKFRNNIMHAKPEISDTAMRDENGHVAIDPAWIDQATPASCRKSFDELRAFRELLQEQLGLTPV